VCSRLCLGGQIQAAGKTPRTLMREMERSMSGPFRRLPPENSFFSAGAIGYPMPKERSFDIDSALDLEIVDLLMKKRQPMTMNKYPRRVSIDLKGLFAVGQQSGNALRPAASMSVFVVAA